MCAILRGVFLAEINSDPAAGVTVLAALGAGVVSFLSPCVLPLVPGYLSAVSGVSPADLETPAGAGSSVPSLLFVASFSAIFIVLGLTATGLGSFFQDNEEPLTKISAALIIAMGVLFVASLFVTRLNREWHVDALLERAGKGGPVVAGAAFAIAWTPCIGPTLGAILSRRRAHRLGRPRRLPARRLLGRPRDPLPAHGASPSRG